MMLSEAEIRVKAMEFATKLIRETTNLDELLETADKIEKYLISGRNGREVEAAND